MDINLTLKADFETVYLINGKLYEGANIEYGANSVVYVTVLPLNAALLPYTVMLVGGTVKCNHALASCYKLEDDSYIMLLKPRYNYVYSVEPQESEPASVAEKFFFLLKRKKAAAARELLTKELSDSVDDPALLCFFDGFKSIISPQQNNGIYYLITDSDTAKPHAFVLKGGLIDNIVEI